jgi:2-polyprenyl-3-methyl-5-hydroxy-6-metoxy-1,4-benzoquinol methylase
MISEEFNNFCNYVYYRENLDGGGRVIAPDFERIISEESKVYDHLVEAGCGASWIGLWLKEKGHCNNLHLVDINPEAIDVVNKTVKGLEKVNTYVSDMFKSVPEGIKFDCIVSNPPNYFDIQSSHSKYGFLSNDLRPSDRGWKFHKEFYKQAEDRLTPDGVIFISEVNMFSDTVVLDGEVYDKRNRPAFEDFKDMIGDNNLEIKDVRYLAQVSKNIGCTPIHILKVGRKNELRI